MTEGMIQLQAEDIILNMEATNKEGALKELAGVLHKHCSHVSIESLHLVLRDREQIGSTGVGNGVAIPHAKVSKLDRIHLGFGRSNEGIGFEAIDNQPVHFIVMILSPPDKPDEYLKTLGAVSRVLKKPEIRQQLSMAEDRNNILEILQDFQLLPERKK